MNMSTDDYDADDYHNKRVSCVNEHRPDYIKGCCRCGVGDLDTWAEHVIDELDGLRRGTSGTPLPSFRDLMERRKRLSVDGT